MTKHKNLKPLKILVIIYHDLIISTFCFEIGKGETEKIKKLPYLPYFGLPCSHSESRNKAILLFSPGQEI